jgi:hypothetical protein
VVLVVPVAKFPGVPIPIIEGHDYTNNWINIERQKNQTTPAKAQATAVVAL